MTNRPISKSIFIYIISIELIFSFKKLLYNSVSVKLAESKCANITIFPLKHFHVSSTTLVIIFEHFILLNELMITEYTAYDLSKTVQVDVLEK